MGTRVYVPLDNEACDDKGGPSATQSRRPNAQSGEVPDAPWGTSLSTSLVSPTPRVTMEQRCGRHLL